MRRAIVTVFLFSLAIAAPAHAYVRTTVDGVPDRPIAWTGRTIPVELASHSSMDVTPADFRAAFDRSLATWTHAGGCTDIVLVDSGEALGVTTNLDGGPYDRRNRVVVRETAWPAIVAPETLAITTVLYDRSTGAILDADTDMNAVAHAFSASDPPPNDHDDIANTLTHELGHLLGFAHSPDPDATMFVSAAPGEILKRDLAADDVHAVCETYPTGAPTPTTLPRAASSCAIASAPRGDFAIWGAFCATLLAGVIRRAVRRSPAAARAAGTACGATRS